ncbi:CG8187 [Drosophila busckii]|uniref:CG8187 n=1 Tax=Drosophila busckii TaxID=30019 RepID=A0A0M4E5I3_DROBS|nr:uncharacterized protein LOC108597420 [Drosophila busckii]ALC41541.1 CG8187 [Drosophila busckii]
MQNLQHMRWLSAVTTKIFIRSASKSTKYAMAGNSLVHNELQRYVNPRARINVKSDIYLHVEPADVHVYTGGDVFIAQLVGEAVDNCTASMEVDISNEDKLVNVVVKKLAQQSRFKCSLKIPVQAEMHIEAQGNVCVKNIQSEALQVQAAGNIVTKNVRATNINLKSENGNIKCEGTLLGKCTEIETHNGNIYMEKLQGDRLTCSTKAGNINTDCCYVDQSKFETTTGQLELKNVHKHSEVHVHQAADINMTGVHGSLNVNSKGGSIQLQLSELMGKSSINVENLKNEAIINISEAIENSTNIAVKACQVSLASELEHVSHALNADKNAFELNNEHQHHLHVCSTGEHGVRLGKQSWTDIMRETMKIMAEKK